MRTFMILVALAGFVTPALATDCADYAAGMKWLGGIQRFGGFSSDEDVAFYGDYAYVALGRIRIVDIADPTNPIYVGDTPGYPGYGAPTSVQVTGNLLVSGRYYGTVRIHSLASPAAPIQIGNLYVTDHVFAVCVVGDLVYVGTIDGLHIVDISDPTDPVDLGVVPDTDVCRRIEYQDGCLYTAMDVPGGRAVRVFRLTDPLAPEPTLTWGMDIYDVMPAEGRLYVSRGYAGLSFFGLLNPAFPEYLGTYTHGGRVETANGVGDLAFPVLSSHAGRIIGVDAPQHGPYEMIDLVDASTQPSVLRFYRGLAYVASYERLDIFDLSRPGGEAAFVGSDENLEAEHRTDVVARGGYAWVGNRTAQPGVAQVEVVDIADPTQPYVATSIALDASLVRDIELVGDLVYVAESRGVSVLDVTDPPNTWLANRIESPGFSLDVAVDDDHMYLASGLSGLIVLSLASDPTVPEPVGQWSEGIQFVVAVDAQGPLAVILDDEGDLRTVDVSDPTAPAVFSEIGGFESGECVVLDGDHAYVDGGALVQVVDVSDPESPVVVRTVGVPAEARDLDLVDGFLHVATDTSGLQIIDVTDPTRARLLGGLSTADVSQGVGVSGDHVLLAAGPMLHLAPRHCLDVTPVDDRAPLAPTAVTLAAYPNPFNPVTSIRYTLPNAAPISLTIHDLAGRRLRTLADGEWRQAGVHELKWDGRDGRGSLLASGVYLMRVDGGGFRAAAKLTLVR